MPVFKKFQWLSKNVRRRSDEADARFGADMEITDWTCMAGLGPDGMVEKFKELVETLTDKHFPI